MRISARNKELFKNTFLFAISNFASKLLVFLMIPLYTSVLSTEDYGLVDIISTTVLLMLPIFTLTISEAVLRFCLSSIQDAKEYFSIGLRITMIGSVIVLFVAIPLVLLLHLNSFYLFIPIIFFLQAYSRLFGRFARGIDKVKHVAVTGVLETFTIVSCNLLLLLVFKMGVMGYLLSMVAGYSVSCLYLFFSCKCFNYISLKSYEKSQVVALCKYSMPLIPNQLCWWLIDSFSKYILILFIGYASVGIYTAAFKFPTVLNVIASFFIDAWLLSVVKEYEKPDSKEYIRRVYGYFSFLMMAIALLITCLSKEIAFVFLKGDFFNGYIYIPLMCLTAAVGGLSSFFSTIFSSEKKTYLNLIPTFVGAAVVVALSYILVPKMDVMGVVIATLAGYIVIWIISFRLTDKIVSWQMNWLTIASEIVLTVTAIVFAMKDMVYISYLCLLVFVFVNLNKIKGVFSLLKRRS